MTCEKCWRDAGGDPDRYYALLMERVGGQCSEEDEAGPDADLCPVCRRKTVHQHAHICVICGWGDRGTGEAKT